MTPEAFQDLVHPYRRELSAHCYRMLGSLADAEDQVQETLLSAWRGIDGFEGRSSVRSWLYRIATNGCLDAIRRRPRREAPEEHGPPADPLAPLADPDGELLWVEPAPATLWEGAPASPEASFSARESVQLAFVVALQHLPATQRAVLILREVVGWSAAEVAALLDTTVASVNSALQRARATLDARRARPDATPATAALVDRYVAAWESGDVAALAALLREDVITAMPPFAEWFQGREALRTFIAPRIGAPGIQRVIRVDGADELVLAFYRRPADAPDGPYEAHALQVVRTAGDLVAEIHAFLDPSLFARFGLPPRLADR
jgi:RNA polymerase sigma-70 factor (TIGR02960 family)